MPEESIVHVGVVGYGYWGPNLARNFSGAPGSRVTAISDLNSERLAEAARGYPAARVTREYREILSDPQIDAVAIATPVSTHFSLAQEALRSGKHVLVEKPLAASSEDAARLIDEAGRQNRVLMVDHTFVYTGAVRKIRELVEAGDLGQIYYYDSVRVNLGLFRHDVNVLWDLGVHDVSIMDYVLSVRPCAVSATGISHVSENLENVAYLTLFFDGNLIAHFDLNWLAPVKLRKILIGGSRKMIIYDDLEPSEKVKVYDRGVTVCHPVENVYKMLLGYRTGDMWAPNLDPTEALKIGVQHFLECIERGMSPTTNGECGMRVVKILEAASESMAARGRPVSLQPG